MITERDNKGRILRVSQSDKHNPNYKGDTLCKIHRGCAYKPLLNKIENKCFYCNTNSNLIAHHLDGNYKNNILSNLSWMCRSCHNKIHILVFIGSCLLYVIVEAYPLGIIKNTDMYNIIFK